MMDTPNVVQQSIPTNKPDSPPVVLGDSTSRRIHLFVTTLLALVVLILGILMLSGRLQFASNQDFVARSDFTVVRQYQEHAKQILANCKDRAMRTGFGVAGPDGNGSGKVEFDDKYSIDVRKTHSLVRPYVGEIKLRRKVLWNKWDGPGKPDAEWKEVTLDSQYEDGSWKTADQQIDGVMGPNVKDNGRPDSPRWEYRTLDYGQTVVFGSVEELGSKGWEVYAVTGGQPYISSSQTTKGAGDTTVTTNTVKFSPKVYYLKRQK
jgi:hypothetical protein